MYKHQMILLLALCIITSCKDQVNDPQDDPLILNTEPGRTEPFGYNDNLGELKTAVVLVRFSDMMPITQTVDTYRQAIFDAPGSVNAFVKEVSYTRAWMAGEVYGWFQSSQEASCDQEVMVQDVLAHTDNEINYSVYDQLIIITPQKEIPCPYPAGRGTIGKITLQTQDGEVSISVQHVIWEGYINLEYQLAAGTIAHEFMHNLGMWHENSYDCNSHSIHYDPRTCTSYEYGNGFSVLGVRKHASHPSAFAKEWIGWLPENEILTARETGRYVIYPLEEASEKPKAIRIPLNKDLTISSVYGEPDYTANEYYVEYRRAIGFDFIESEFNNPGSVNMDGVFVYTWAERENRNVFFEADKQILTFLLDMTPETVDFEFDQSKTDDFSDGLLRIGKTFHDEENDLQITPLHIRSDGGIEVHVSIVE